MPFYLDQPQNAAKIVGLGCAPRAIRYSASLSAAALAAAVAKAMDPAQPFAASAKRVGAQVRAESAGACDRYADTIASCKKATVQMQQ